MPSWRRAKRRACHTTSPNASARQRGQHVAPCDNPQYEHLLRPPAQRHLFARLPSPGHRLHPAVADAPSRALPARVQGHARPGGQLHGPGHQRGLRHRGHAAAAGTLSAGCGHFVQRHPHRARRHGPGPVLCRGRRPALCQSHPHRGRRGPARRARPEQAALCVRCRHQHPQGAEWPCAADRLFGQPLDAGLLHGRRQGQRRLPPGQEPDVQPPRPDAPHPGRERRRRGRLPECADRRGRPGGDDF